MLTAQLFVNIVAHGDVTRKVALWLCVCVCVLVKVVVGLLMRGGTLFADVGVRRVNVREVLFADETWTQMQDNVQPLLESLNDVIWNVNREKQGREGG